MKRRIEYGLWLAAAACLWFFENNTGTLAVLLFSLLIPLIPSARRALFRPDREPVAETRTVREKTGKEDEPSDIRAYQSGDPLNRIHWKLSAKRDALLVRAPDAAEAEKETEESVPARENGAGRGGKRTALMLLASAAGALLLLFTLPTARRGLFSLLNRLFEESEAVNAYVYGRIAVSGASSAELAASLLAFTLAALLAAALLSLRRLCVLCFPVGCAAFQAYFGLSFPAWVNVPLFALFFLCLLRRPTARRDTLTVLAAAVLVSVAVALFLPGTNAAVETASEKARDALCRMTGGMANAAREEAAGETETRHTHTRSPEEGNGEAAADREYRVVTREEERISAPHWFDILKTVLMLLLAAAILILPFLPFAALNARRKQAREIRAVFEGGDVSEAVCAIFAQAAACLEALGLGETDKPYAAWPETALKDLPADYAARFLECAEVFEEAAYSDHALGEENRAKALELLRETEEICMGTANLRQRLRLRFGVCLWD